MDVKKNAYNTNEVAFSWTGFSNTDAEEQRGLINTCMENQEKKHNGIYSAFLFCLFGFCTGRVKCIMICEIMYVNIRLAEHTSQVIGTHLRSYRILNISSWK